MAEYKPIQGFEGLYSISKEGGVYSHKSGRAMSPYVGNHGYVAVSLRKDGKRHYCLLHRLLATAFIENPENKPEVNHKDFNRANYSLENLEWCTHKENMIHCWEDRIKVVHPKTGKYNRNLSTRREVLDLSSGNVYPNLMLLVREKKLSRSKMYKELSGHRKNTTNYIYV